MRYFFRRRIPPLSRVLLVESGPRHVLERFLSFFYGMYGDEIRFADLVTCYGGLPAGFREQDGKVYHTADYSGREGRKRLYAELRRNGYSVLVMLCAASPILLKWKFSIGARLPAKILIVNENADYFWLDRKHWSTVVQFVLVRTGLAGGNAVPTFARLFTFPFTLLYLLLFAAMVHLRRKART